MNVGAIVLAAGASLRMGSPKALLKIGNKTFLQHIVNILHLAGIAEVVIVVGSDSDAIRKSLSWFDGAVVFNKQWKNGQLTSIIEGLNAFGSGQLDGLLICPVDRPLITPAVINDLLSAFQKSGKPIVVPVFQGRRGHPAFFSTVMFDELRNAPLDIGARHVLHRHPHDICEVVTEEEGTVLNIDTPDDYREYIKRGVGL